MRAWRRRLGWTGIALAVFLVAAGVAKGEPAAESRPLRVATAGAEGRHYRLGTALARMWEQLLGDVAVEALPTGGGVHNLALLADGDVDVAIVPGEVAYGAYYGDTRPYGELRLLAPLYPEVAHFIAPRGRTGRGGGAAPEIAVGLAGSRDEAVAQAVIPREGGPAGARFQFFGVREGFDYLRLGWIDGLFALGPLPADFARELLEPGPYNIGIRDLDEAVLAAAADKPWTFPFTIPPDTYPHQPEAVRTFAVPLVLVVRADFDAEMTYRLAKALDEGRHLLADALPVYRWVPVRLPLADIPLPLHSGAALHLYETWGAEGDPALLP